MKKILSVILAIAILCTALAVSAYASEAAPDLGFAVASDLHLNLPAAELEKTNDDSIFWYANRRAAMENESGYIIDSFLSQCASDGSVEYVLISGDMADSGRTKPEEHYAIAEKFRKFEAETGKQIFVIDGNHDLGNGSLTDIAQFKEIYAEFGYDNALVQDETTCSYTADLGEKYRLIALDSCDHDRSTAAGLTSERLDWVKAQTQIANNDGRYPILMMHHNLLDHMPLQPVLSGDFIVKNHFTVAEKFADWGIKLVFTGHEHCSDAATYTSALGNIIYDFATTSLTMYPLQYRVFALADDEISYKAETVKSIDTAALSSIVNGYTPEQLSLMNEDLNQYALGFLKAGIQYRLSLSMTPEKLGISEDDIYYNIVMTAVNGLTDLLEMPLYGEEETVEALGKEFNIVLPETSYKNGWDLVTRLVAMHYEGEENFPMDSAEITLFLKLAAILLRTDIPAVADSLFFGAGDAIFTYFGTTESGIKLKESGMLGNNRITAGEYMLLAIASPIIYEFANDTDSVNDNNGIIPGYGAANDNFSNISANFTLKFNKLIKELCILLRYIQKINAR